MPIYPFRCEECGKEIEIIAPIKRALPRPSHCYKKMEQIISTGGFILGRTPGATTGFYDLDYGKRATEDLTAPGKMDQLKKEGRINDPFDKVAPNSGENQGDLGRL